MSQERVPAAVQSVIDATSTSRVRRLADAFTVALSRVIVICLKLLLTMAAIGLLWKIMILTR